MGGRGSGRSSGLATIAGKCDQYHSIDLAWLRQKKLLVSGRWSSIMWSRAGSQTGSIRIKGLDSGVRLVYRQRQHGEDWRDVSEFVPFVETETRFGGRRQWFRCLSCGGRCRILYGGAHFRCRRCYRLKYESQYEAAYSRACSQAHKIRQRLGGYGSLDDPFPLRPKGMHRRTYRQLERREQHLQNRWAVGVIQWMQLLR